MPTKTARGTAGSRGAPAVGGVHLLLGPELGGQREYVEQLVAAARKQFGEVDLLKTFPYDTDLVDLVATLRTPGLFEPHRVVLLQEAQDLRAGNQLNALVEYCGAPAPASTLVLATSGMSSDLSSPLLKAVPRARQKIFWEMFENQRQGWLVRFFRERDIQISADACELILELVPANTAALETVCGDLASFLGAGASVGTEQIERYIYHSKDENVFTLFDRVAERDLQGALETLTTLLLSRRGDAVQIVGALLSQFLRVTQLKELLAGGAPMDEALRKLRVSSKRLQRTLRSAHERYRDHEMAAIQDLLVEFDARARLFGQELTEPLLQLLLYHAVARGGRGAWRRFRV